ncbi:META domain-containing protein [Massilia sp. HP4]|uniref:META domain-containing protein n=1 Tax=Massilia sp. HP4 TaxID=2562316 RepID=UPI0010C0E1E7|nr:META domain-containing protein [Massilia sp. HP4]
MSTSSSMTVVFAAVLCAACSIGAPPAGGSAGQDSKQTALVGTTWQLHEIQSMDDAQGVTRPQPGRIYTVHLSPDGRAALQLDCNRGTTSYTQEAGEPGRGVISFANVAMTRMMCPEGSLDTRIARDMGNVRSYTLQGGTLSMSLMADGGIYVWKPVPAALPSR